jgi:hypothetical protein
MAQRNPYLVLGVDYGSSPDVARQKFALAARRLRSSPNALFTVEDLTWALHELEQIGDTAPDKVDYFRVPANPDVYTKRGEGVFLPSAIALERRTTSDEAARQSLRQQVTKDTARHLLRAIAEGVEFNGIYKGTE